MKRHLIPLFLIIAVLTMTSAAAATQTQAAETQDSKQTEATSKAADSGTASASAAFEVRKKGSKYYLYRTANNTVVSGYKGITEYPAGSGNFYYFLNSQGRIKLGMFKKSGKYYYSNPDGTLFKGWRTIDKRTYYFSKKTFARLSGRNKIGKKYYYFSPETGIQIKGFVKIKNAEKGTVKTYYFNPAQKGAMATGLTKISKKYYYFRSSGTMKTGLIKIDGKPYFFDQTKGYRCGGLKTWKGKTYYFAKKAGYSCITGWKKTKDGSKYYFSSKEDTYGQAVTGWMLSNKKAYYFDESGKMQTGWQTINSKKYYFDPETGVMATGEVTIDGTKYTFGTNGVYKDPVESATGPWSVRVNQSTCVVTVYRGNTPVKAMLCSVGLSGPTPCGTFSLGEPNEIWHELNGGVWGQYSRRITGNILFHSVYYYQYGNIHSFSTGEYVKLGSPASAGCVRLSTGDAYYLWSNVPTGTPVSIDYYGNTDPLPRPQLVPLNGADYDVTDPILGD